MKWLITGLMGVVILVVAGCEKPDRSVRHYREVSFVADDAKPASPAVVAPMDVDAIPAAPSAAPASPGMSRMPDLPPEMRTPSLPLEWDTPEGWENLGGSGMRIATLMAEGQECTILTFPGDVGGDEANIRRWLGQIGKTVPDAQLRAFVNNPVRFTTAGGYECRLFDFADVLPPGASPGTLAGIIVIDDHSAFIKMTGPADILARQKAAFERLCRSIRMQSSTKSY